MATFDESILGVRAPAAGDALLGAARVADRRQQALGLPPVRPHGPHEHAAARRAWAPASCASRARRRALAMSTDGNGRYTYLNPRRGAMLALAEAARNVACAGGIPIGATNCLNFGNPERPEIMWQFAEAVEGLAEACRALDIPITGGNVSLYNETDGQAIYPTPIIGVVGLIEDASRTVSRTFKRAGDDVVLLGEGLRRAWRQRVPQDDARHRQRRRRRGSISTRTRADRAADAGAAAGLLQSAHDCSDGGLAVTLAECAFDTGGIGLDGRRAAPAAPGESVAAALFGESASRAVVVGDAGAIWRRCWRWRPSWRAGRRDRTHRRRAIV